MTDMQGSPRAAEILRAIALAAHYQGLGQDERAKYWLDYAAYMERQATCVHAWSEPIRANNQFGFISTSLYSTTCRFCGKTETRNGKARLTREVIDA